MNSSLPNRKIDDLPSADEKIARDWSEHEHVADAVSKEAQHLVRIAGSTELAKQAIDAVQDNNASMPAAAKEELARDLGYSDVGNMMEQTEIVALPTGSFMHLTADSDGFWVAWSDKPYYDFQRFESRQQALTSLREHADSISSQS